MALTDKSKAVQSPESSESWFSRLGDSLISVCVGIALIPLSIAFLWVNEKRNARQETLIELGQSEVAVVDAKTAISVEAGSLVHMTADAHGVNPITDSRFPSVKMDSGCLRLRTRVQVFQWVEHKEEKTQKNSLGGGTTTSTRCTYAQEWSDEEIDSSKFQQRGRYHNAMKVPGLRTGWDETFNTSVKFGDEHYLSLELVRQLDDFKDASGLVPGGSLTVASKTFEQSNGWFHYPPRKAEAASSAAWGHGKGAGGKGKDKGKGKGYPGGGKGNGDTTGSYGSAEIGDVRVKFEYIPDGPVTALALQAEGASSGSFLPYRLVWRGFCGVDKEQLQKRLLAEGQKDGMQLYEDDKCDFGPFACLCCCCNCITMCFANFAPPQIYNAFHGRLSVAEAFSRVEAFGLVMKWGSRLLGWLLLYIGTYALFEPLFVVLDIVPFLGPYISDGLSWVVGAVVLLITLLISACVVSLAYMIYHPLVGLAYLTVTAGIVAGVMAISQKLNASL